MEDVRDISTGFAHQSRYGPLLAHPHSAGVFSDRELDVYDDLRFTRRKRDYLMGRFLTKHLVKDLLMERFNMAYPLNQISVISGREGMPVALLDTLVKNPILIDPDLKVSISHRNGYAFSGVSTNGEYRGIGVDVEMVEEKDLSFLEDFFSDDEIMKLSSLWDRERQRMVAIYWSIKEAVLKSIGKGLTVDARTVDVKEIVFDGIDFKVKNIKVKGWPDSCFRIYGNESGGIIKTIALIS